MLKDDLKKDVGKVEYKRNFKERVHISKSKIDTYSNAIYLKVGESKYIYFSNDIETRYIAAVNMTYDLLISIFDANTRKSFAYRAYKYDDSIIQEMEKFVKQLKKDKPNLEARIIGFQNNEEDSGKFLAKLADFFVSNNIKLLEVDLFNTNIRHIALDTKLGTTYNVLLEDRLYRAGELINSMTNENFENSLKKEQQK